MRVPEQEKEVQTKKATPKKKNKKAKKKNPSSEEENTAEDDEEEAADYVVEAVMDKKEVFKVFLQFVYHDLFQEPGKRGRPGKTLYLVKWAGWDRPEDLTWEPLEHLKDPDGVL